MVQGHEKRSFISGAGNGLIRGLILGPSFGGAFFSGQVRDFV